jgi:hypothetical protein
MATERLWRLDEVLATVDTLPWNLALFTPKSGEWSLDTTAAVLDPDDAAEDEEEPRFARDLGLKYVLGIQAVQDVAENARAQKPNIDLEGLLGALRYYYEHDAFVQLRGSADD